MQTNLLFHFKNFSIMNYSFFKHGYQWCVFCATSRCVVLYCNTEKEARTRCNELNRGI